MTSKREEVIEVIDERLGLAGAHGIEVYKRNSDRVLLSHAIADALLERMPYLQWECVAHWGDTNTSIEFRKEHEWEDVEVDTPQQQTICANCGRVRKDLKPATARGGGE